MKTLFADSSLVNWPDGPLAIVAAGREENVHLSEPHSHARGQLFASLRGLLTVGVDEAVWVVPTIHAVWVPPHHRHWGQWHGPFEGWSAYIREEACAALPAHTCTIRTSGLLREAVLRAAEWPLERSVPLSPAQERIAQIIVDEIRSAAPEPLGLPMLGDARLGRIARALVQDPADPRGLEEWAAWGAVSSRTLSRRFVSETGFTFSAWRQRAKLMRALEMLAAGQPVNAIALDLGYATSSALIAVFRQQFGETPANYRERLLQKNSSSRR